MSRARSAPNIALIKYWGNRNERLRLPAGSSLSMTLNGPTVDVTVSPADMLSVTSVTLGSEKILTEKDVRRFANHAALMNEYLLALGCRTSTASLDIRIESNIPPGIGLASSAAVFSALAKAVAGLVQNDMNLTDEHISVLARLGSGSAARSIHGGYVSLENRGDEAVAIPVAPAHHWNLHDIVIVPSREEKAVGSTEGHALACTSPYFAQRLEAVEKRFAECRSAILEKDFLKLQAVAEADSLNMHYVMETGNPPLRYLNEVSHRLMRDIVELRERKHLPVLYTMDAGPTVHLLCTDEALPEVRAFAKEQKDCTLFETTVGDGAHCVA